MSDARPIGFFDSGLGGLTVLRTVRQELPNENIVYLGDTARLPYGTKSPDTIRRYTEQNIRALLSFDVKAIVIACNSASTALLQAGTGTKIEAPVPLYNVIEPGARTANASSTTKRIGVLGTRATVGSNAYAKALHAIEPGAVVYQQAAPLLVPLVEEGWESDPITNLVVYRYIAPLMAQQIDTLILGCTHYPALRESILRVTGQGVTLVDSAQAILQEIRRDFTAGKLEPNTGSDRGSLKLLATDNSPAMIETARRLMGDPALSAFESFDL